MLKRFLLLTAIVLAGFSFAFAQTGTLKGKIYDSKTKEAISFANVVLEVGGKSVGGAASDMDGNFTIKPIPPGKYDLKTTYVGYKPVMIKGIVISADKIAFQDLALDPTVEVLKDFIITEYKVPLIQQDQTSSGQTMTSEEISKMATRGASAVAVQTGGVFSQDGDMGSVRGSREEGTVVYIDGVRVRGSQNVPQSSIDQVSMIVGGTPAQYGDATGGVLNITTKPPTNKFEGGFEFLTSHFLDAYDYNLFGFNLQGPILRDSAKTSSKIGFIIAGEVSSELDPDPSNIGIYRLKKDRLDSYKNDIFRVNSSGALVNNAYFFTKDDFENVKVKDNTSQKTANVNAKLDFKITKTSNLTLGISYSYDDSYLYNYANTFFNYDNNLRNKGTTIRGFAKFTQKFITPAESKSLFKNIYYTIQADYTKDINEWGSNKHWDNLFDYGYIGKFDTKGPKSYANGTSNLPTPFEVYIDPANPKLGTKTIYSNKFSTYTGLNYNDEYSFTPSDINSDLALYNTEIYNTIGGDNIEESGDLTQFGGLLNGDQPNSLYGYANMFGTVRDIYQKQNNDQISFKADFSMDIGEHEIKLGAMYEQRKDRLISYNPVQLWSLMRQLVNRHRNNIDQVGSNYYYKNDTLVIDYNHIYEFNNESYFSYNLRKNLGFNNTEWVDIDSLSPDLLSIDWFSPADLIEGGFGINYYGYDYTGKILNSNPSFDDFFLKTGNQISYNTISNYTGNDTTLYKSMYLRPIGAYEPNYMAFYIQDKFAFKDLIFNLGLRIDRFDANQMVPKDPYAIIPIHTIGSAKAEKIFNFNQSIPGNITDDFSYYVNEAGTEIEAFRKDDNWYDKDGVLLNEQSLLQKNIRFIGVQTNKSQVDVNSEAFEDYEPEINFLPRIAFSFPVSDAANFFAHYDVLTNRPLTGVRMYVMDYYTIKNVGANTINNPNLKSEKVREYELGFQQKLSKTSAIKASVYYKELKDFITNYRFIGAYPSTYISYKNRDFGTVKGFTVSYDLRRTGNVWVKAAYTLQFADGTGSTAESALTLVRQGQSSLRASTPLSYDRRHSIVGTIDYRFADGKEYNGPGAGSSSKFGKVMTSIFQNFGANATINSGSGIPYTRQRFTGNAKTSINNGSLNGSRMPWQMRVDLKVDKDIIIKVGKTKKKDTYLNVYLQVLNVLDKVNIMNVYNTTGNPDDDGYLSAPEAQKDIYSQINAQSFIDFRRMYINNPDNYSLPRRIRLGVSYSF